MPMWGHDFDATAAAPAAELGTGLKIRRGRQGGPVPVGKRRGRRTRGAQGDKPLRRSALFRG